jgi:tetratricopeptide (TPR) repeat protein
MEDREREDVEHWEAVEEATEMLIEGDYHEALIKLRDVIKTDPRNSYAYFYAGTALFEIGQFEAAATAYRAAVRLAPRYLAARVGLSHALRILEEHRAAMAEARKALEIAPGDGDALYALGLVQLAMGDKVGARRSIEALLHTGPDFVESTEARSLLQRLQPSESDRDNDEDDVN